MYDTYFSLCLLFCAETLSAALHIVGGHFGCECRLLQDLLEGTRKKRRSSSSSSSSKKKRRKNKC